MERDPHRVHLPDGYLGAVPRISALCSRGWVCPPARSRASARYALDAEHGLSAPFCQLCGRDQAPGARRHNDPLRWFRLDVVTGRGGREQLVCHDQVACRYLVRSSPATGRPTPAGRRDGRSRVTESQITAIADVPAPPGLGYGPTTPRRQPGWRLTA